jgi:hypothetical protein
MTRVVGVCGDIINSKPEETMEPISFTHGRQSAHRHREAEAIIIHLGGGKTAALFLPPRADPIGTVRSLNLETRAYHRGQSPPPANYRGPVLLLVREDGATYQMVDRPAEIPPGARAWALERVVP